MDPKSNEWALVILLDRGGSAVDIELEVRNAKSRILNVEDVDVVVYTFEKGDTAWVKAPEKTGLYHNYWAWGTITTEMITESDVLTVPMTQNQLVTAYFDSSSSPGPGVPGASTDPSPDLILTSVVPVGSPGEYTEQVYIDLNGTFENLNGRFNGNIGRLILHEGNRADELIVHD